MVELIEQILPLASAFFAHEDDGVSEEVLDFITGYIKMLKGTRQRCQHL